MSVNAQSVFLVSGGARGITAQCIIRLAERYQSRFILMGRSPIDQPEPSWAAGRTDQAEMKKAIIGEMTGRGEKPTPVAVQKTLDSLLARREIESNLRAIESAGGKALYFSVDVTDAAGVKNAVAQAETQLGKVTGLIHGAGNLADKLIENKTEKDFELVYAAKVQGLDNMLSAVNPSQLEHVVLFSSVAGFYGNIGQADYSIANEILNKAAYRLQQQYPNLHVVSINWGPWDAGMVTPELKAYFAQHHIPVIPVDVGAQMLIDELEAGKAHGSIQVVVGAGIGILRNQPDTTLKTHRLRRTLVLNANPFLQDHVVNGKAVLPMVSAMSWMANACEQLYPGYRYVNFETYKVLKGVIFDETLADEYILDLKEVLKTEDRIEFDAMVSSEPNGKKRFHYSTRIALTPVLPEAPIYTNFDRTVRENLDGETLYQNGTLFHQFSFKGVQRVLNISPEKVTMICQLPQVDEDYQGQFPVQSYNYFMVDIGFQSMGIYARHFYQAGSLPLQAGSGEHYGDVDFGETFYVSLEIKTASPTGLVTDLYVHDENGRVYMKVLGGEVTISDRLNDLFLLNKLPEPIR